LTTASNEAFPLSSNIRKVLKDTPDLDASSRCVRFGHGGDRSARGARPLGGRETQDQDRDGRDRRRLRHRLRRSPEARIRALAGKVQEHGRLLRPRSRGAGLRTHGPRRRIKDGRRPGSANEEGKRTGATKRFDRTPQGRSHMHTASGLLYVDHRQPAIDYGMLHSTADVRTPAPISRTP
jgi:hypothetical protein